MKEQIYNILNREGTVTRKVLHLALVSQGYHINDRALRAMIEEMIVDDKYSISSSEKGYAVIKDGEDLRRATEYLDKKSAAIAVRKNCLKRNFHHYLRKQLELDFI